MKAKLCLLALSCFLISINHAQETDNRTERFNFSKVDKLKIDNSFGDISVQTYGGQMIDILVEITLTTKNQKDLEKNFDNIKIRTTETKELITVVTENKMNGNNSVKSFRIDYTVKLPAGMALEIENRFGDVTVSNTSGKINLDVQHGSCFVTQATARGNQAKVQFGDLKIDYADGNIIHVQHGDLRVTDLKNSKINVQFGDSKIEKVTGTGDFDIQHGDLRINYLQNGLTNLQIVSQFSDVKLGNILGSSYVIDLEGSFADFSWDGVLNTSNGDIRIVSQKKDITNTNIQLHAGSEKTPQNKITVRSSHGSVELE